MDALNYVADKFKHATDRAIDGVQTAREAAGLKHSKERVEKIAFAIEDREDETRVAREPQNPILRMGVPFPRMEAIFAANSERLHWNASRNDPTYAVAVLELRAEDDERREAVDWDAIETRGPGEEYRRVSRATTAAAARAREARLRAARDALPPRFRANLVAAYNAVLAAYDDGRGPRALRSRDADRVLARVHVPVDDALSQSLAWVDADAGDGHLTLEDLLLAVAETPHVLAHLRRREDKGAIRGHEDEVAAVLAKWHGS